MQAGGPDVEGETVLAHGGGGSPAGGRLHTDGAEAGCVTNAFPRRGRLRRVPAKRAGGGRGVGDPFEDERAEGGDLAGEFSLGDADVGGGELSEKCGGNEEEQQSERQQFSHGLSW